MRTISLISIIQKIPPGYSEGMYNHKKYGITREDFNNGKSIKIFAKELAGKNFISLNFYITSTGELLKPCEMPKDKVIQFLTQYKPLV